MQLRHLPDTVLKFLQHVSFFFNFMVSKTSNLLKTILILVLARAYPEKAGQSALDAAKNISTILTAIKASTPRVEGITDFTVTAKEIEQLLQSVIDNTNKPKVIIKGTKALAPLIADLMTVSKKVASLLPDHNAQQKLIKVSHTYSPLKFIFPKPII